MQTALAFMLNRVTLVAVQLNQEALNETSNEPYKYYRMTSARYEAVVRRIAAHMEAVRDAHVEDDCWLSTSVDQRGGYGRIKAIGTDQRSTMPTHRLVKYLFTNGVERLNSLQRLPGTGRYILQASHRCGKNNCFNPNHLVWETDEVNKSRSNCMNGCFTLCPHNPKCVWTTVLGCWDATRNVWQRFYPVEVQHLVHQALQPLQLQEQEQLHQQLLQLQHQQHLDDEDIVDEE